MKNPSDIPISNPPAVPSLDSDPQQVNQAREKLRSQSQARFEELASQPMLPRED